MTDHHRWASAEMLTCFSPTINIGREHQIWIEVMRMQKSHGIPISDEAFADYLTAHREYIDNAENWIEQVLHEEQTTRHDLKARLNVFDSVANGHGLAHLGMTSSDIVDTIWQVNTRDALRLVNDRAAMVFCRLAGLASGWRSLPITGRTHGQPAQVVTLGKRIADLLHPMYTTLQRLRQTQRTTRLRGVAGAVGTHGDMRALYQANGLDPHLVYQINEQLGEFLGMKVDHGYGNQGYPRPTDHQLIAQLVDLAHVCAQFAQMVRLMTLQGLGFEYATAGQVGSSAMPHKRNPRFAERIMSLTSVMRGYQLMAAETATSQWFEGDVANSAARRIYLPGAFYALDGILAATYVVADGFAPDSQAVRDELRTHADELATGRLLAEAVAAGMSREVAHAKIRQAAQTVHETGGKLSVVLAQDPDFPVDTARIFQVVNTIGEDVDGSVVSVESIVDLEIYAREWADWNWKPVVL